MKNNALTVLIGVIITLFLTTACTSTGESKQASAEQTAAAKAQFETAYAAAKAAQRKAAAVGGEWRDIGKFLKQAEQAAENGDPAKGIALANQARLQGEMGYQQALAQKDAGPRF